MQALPSADSQRLSQALAQLGRNPRDVEALIAAGDAANALGDPEAAAGFYTRAEGISANNPRVQAGLARALVLQGDPTKAIPLFARAEAGGAAVEVAADRGLAYDLVGDPATAQTYYRTALARKDDDEVRRRLGVSLAIAGDAAGAEAMLMPLLRKQDKPGWRSHAFALAIAGKTKEAVDTANAILPQPLAQSVTPYLRYMPKLTRAQQAAAANLGKFPRAAEIGRDDPAIAAYAASSKGTRVAAADAGLVPQGRPLGGARAATQQAAPEALSRAQTRTRDRAARLARAKDNAAARVAPPEPAPAIKRDSGGELPPVGGTALATASPAAATSPAAAALPASAQPSLRTAAASQQASSQQTSSQQTSSQQTSGVSERPTGGSMNVGASAPGARMATLQLPDFPASSSPSALARPLAGSQTSASPTAASPTSASPRAVSQAAGPATPAPGFELTPTAVGANSAPSSAPAAGLAQSASAPTSAADFSPPPSPDTLEQIFADLGAPSRAPAPVAGAVDVLSIEPAKPAPPPAPAPASPAETAKPAAAEAGKKTAEAAKGAEKAPEANKANDKKAGAKKGAEKASATSKSTDKKAAEKKAAEKKAPSHPSRLWVQIGVGRDKSAIAFDWRRMSKAHGALFKGREPHVTAMGRTNRILAGPFETQKAASGFAAQVKKAEIADAFVWTSPAGQAVEPLTGN